jgi:hypothetical protein
MYATAIPYLTCNYEYNLGYILLAINFDMYFIEKIYCCCSANYVEMYENNDSLNCLLIMSIMPYYTNDK